MTRRGSTNVFAALGRRDAEELQAKASLVAEISRILEERDLTQREAAKLLGVDQPKVSALLNGRLSGFSFERLLRFLALLDQQVTIQVRPSRSRSSRKSLRVEATP